jgi:hypothetical protein
VREAAYDCVTSYDDGVADKKAVLASAIDQVAKETSPGVQTAMFGAIRSRS